MGPPKIRMASRLDVRFHCTKRARRSLRKSRHDVESRCETVKRVLHGNPEYGLPIPGHPKLRKMRIQVPAARLGKRGGYRCIYRKARIDEIEYVTFLEIYFKGDVEDLTPGDYERLSSEAEEILVDPLGVDWEDLFV